MAERRMQITNVAQTELRGHSFVTFDVAMNGHVISTVDAPRLSGRILWSHAAIHGFGDFDCGERTLLEAEVDRVLEPASPLTWVMGKCMTRRH
ncbi:hypothetical protein J2045_004402 [Peteryoungia aggregata LMG 23059]|uniref:Uncharacterized protein n=1 Tax=Peteryoungia aggregata LMG 23059 TaxID=1368425 RepID=A0ABU0GDC2_9HYPH|nr:hypothetical protein [Peteryoungia aggregata]MDQ0423350.1 hypothetical protein [Peteryoungia aggregata LMG 23059]